MQPKKKLQKFENELLTYNIEIVVGLRPYAKPIIHYKEKPFGIKWPDEPIKALGVYFTYDQKLLKEKNFIERLDSIKNLLIYGPLEAYRYTVR